MSKCFHVARKDFKGLSKKETNEMVKDLFSLPNQWAVKIMTKTEAIRKRKIQKLKSED